MLALAGLAWLCYAPGLNGTFLFDDAANLPSLGAFGPVHDGTSLLQYVTSGKADPTGRPVALLSFLIDSRNWPAAPYPFKRTNLIIHLLNAALLGAFLSQVGMAMRIEAARARLAGILGAAFWALNPMQVSTVLYVVQREAMLPATFMLLAALCWLSARKRFSTGPRGATALAIVGVACFTALASLSKANGLLVPLLVLVCEWVLPADDAIAFRKRLVPLVALPAAILVGWLLWSALASIGSDPIAIRGWTIGQRLLTEPSILFQYLAQLWLVTPTESSLLHDDVLVAHGFFDPWYTGVAVGGCLALIAAAAAARRRWPFVAFAILFYFAGHLMESTSLALELYFDHRNYLPSMPMFWPVALLLTAGRRPALERLAGALVIGTLAILTWSNARLWGDPARLAITWATGSPGSARAQAYAAQVLGGTVNLGEGASWIDAAVPRFPGEPQVAFTAMDLHCAQGGLRKGDLEAAKVALRTAQREPGAMLLAWYDRTIPRVREGRCQGLDRSALTSLLDAALANPRISAVPGRQQDILHARGEIALAWGEPEAALDLFGRALDEWPTPQAALEQSAMLGRAGFPALGLRHLERYRGSATVRRMTWRDGMPWIHEWILEREGYWPREMAHLHSALARGAAEPN